MTAADHTPKPCVPTVTQAMTQNVTHTHTHTNTHKNITVTQKQHQCREEAGTATVTTQPNWLQMMIKFKLEKEPKVKHLKD